MNDLVSIGAFIDRHEAELCAEILFKDGIDGFVSEKRRTDDGTRENSESAFVQLLVKRENAKAAQALVHIIEDELDPEECWEELP